MEDILEGLLPTCDKSTRRELVKALIDHRIVNEIALTGARLQDVPHLLRYQVEMLVEVGLLLKPRDKSKCLVAKALGQAICELPDVEFSTVKKFSGVPWPGLEPMIPQRVQTDHNRKLEWIGRTGFSALEEEFLGLSNKQCLPLDYDGPMGAGKTYLLLMLAVKLLHDFAKCKPKRLLALFSAHQSLEKVQVMVRDALLLAFWDDEQIQYKIFAASERGELDIVVEDLKANHEFQFIFDNWNVYDEAPACRVFLETIASGCPCIRGGSVRQDLVRKRLSHGAYPNYHKGQYEGFSEEELDVYLGDNKNIDRTDMLFWTGNFPLHVRLYLAAGNKYRVTNEVTALEAGLYDMVHRALELQGEARRSRLESFARLLIGEGDTIDFLEATDTRWITMREGKVQLVSEFARSLLMGKLERARGANALS